MDSPRPHKKGSCYGDSGTILLGVTCMTLSLYLFQPEKGRAVFALSSVQWGAFKDAMENRDRYVCLTIINCTHCLFESFTCRFWVFGKLRLLASHIGTAMRVRCDFFPLLPTFFLFSLALTLTLISTPNLFLFSPP